VSEVPTFEYEQRYWQVGKVLVAGVDEVGVGALAGPVCAGAVMFNHASKFSIFKGQFSNTSLVIKDSKQLSEKQREEAAEWIKENALFWSVGEASVEEIEKINILQAARVAMRRAIESLSVKPEALLVDGLPRLEVEKRGGFSGAYLPTEFIMKGDGLSFSIAAASILAKVYRDKIMIKLADEYPSYGWDSNKGYGSLKHRVALKELGITKHHRKTYAPVAKHLI